MKSLLFLKKYPIQVVIALCLFFTILFFPILLVPIVGYWYYTKLKG